MSVSIASTCMPRSNARYSATVSATLGVMILSIAGSSARLRNSTERLSAPDSSRLRLKYCASEYCTPIAANTTAKSSFVPTTDAWRAICAASMLCGMPEPEKIGNFCPLTRVSMPSITDTPVWMKDVGYSRRSGFMGSPLTSRNLSAIGSGRPSFGLPRPSNTLPSSSCETGISIVLPRNFAFVPVIVRPVVPSNTWTIALPKPTSSTLPSLRSPSAVSISTSSSNDTFVMPSITMSGPLISATFVYSTPAVSGNYLRLLCSAASGLLELAVYLLVQVVQFVQLLLGYLELCLQQCRDYRHRPNVCKRGACLERLLRLLVELYHQLH